MSGEIAISTNGLTKYFNGKAVVRDLNMKIPKGSVTGVLGLNGAGKTTTIRMLMGMLEPTRGSCSVLGVDSLHFSPEDRAKIGYTAEGHFLYGWMSVRQAEQFQRGTFPVWDSSLFCDTVKRFSIDASQKISSLSRGQRAGVSIALMLAAEPEVLILDDPSLGLDPVSRHALNETLIDFCDGGKRTVLLSSHLLDDIERVADRVAIMVHGRILVDTTIDDFRNRVAAWAIDVPPASRVIESVPGLIQSRQFSGRTIVTVADPDQETLAAIERISNTPPETVEQNFEDAVIAYLSRSRSDESFLARSGTK